MVHVSRAEVSIPGFLVLLFAGENEGVDRAQNMRLYPFGFMNLLLHQSVVSHFEINTGPMPTHSIIHYRCGAIADTNLDAWRKSYAPVCIDVLPQ